MEDHPRFAVPSLNCTGLVLGGYPYYYICAQRVIAYDQEKGR